MFRMTMKAMATAAAIMATCGLAASMFLGIPVGSMMHSAGEGIMGMAGPAVTADSVRDLIAKSKEQIAKATPAIERLRKQAAALTREENALRHDLPVEKARVERMLETLDRAGDVQIIHVNGQPYPRLQVEADIHGAMGHFKASQDRLARLPVERQTLERQVQRLERERAEAWTRIAGMEREVNELESRGQVAEATKQASEITVREAGGLGRQMARLRDMVESVEAMNQTFSQPGMTTTIDWDGGEGLFTKARELGLNVNRHTPETEDKPSEPSVATSVGPGPYGG